MSQPKPPGFQMKHVQGDPDYKPTGTFKSLGIEDFQFLGKRKPSEAKEKRIKDFIAKLDSDVEAREEADRAEK